MSISRRQFSLAVLASFAASRTMGASRADDTARMRAVLVDWVDRQRQSLGVSAGLVDERGDLFASYGVLGLDDPRPVNADTVFGIASMTKVFTGLLLADAVLRKEVALTDPVRLYLPQEQKLPTFDGREITLHDLAMHATGLPQEIPDYAAVAAGVWADPNRPLFDFLANHTLIRPIGESWAYSNMNYALIGIALAMRTGRSYAQLIRDRIARPLGLHSTGVEISRDMKSRRASPHLDTKTAAPEWNKPWSLGAGSLQSTATDLLRFVAYASGLKESKLSNAFSAMLATRISASFLGGEQAIGWGIDASSGDPRIFFAGKAPGFTSTVMFDPKTKCGVVALCNSAVMVEPVAREILRPGSVAAAAAKLSAIAPHPVFDRLVGRYALVEAIADVRFAAGEIVEVTRTPTGIALSMPRYPKAGLKLQSEGVFQIEGFPVRCVFPSGENSAPSLLLTVGGKTVPANRQ